MDSSNMNLNKGEVLSNLNEIICSFSNKKDFQDIEEGFYKSISSIIPAHATAIYLFNSKKRQPDYISSNGVDVDFLTYYEKRGREIDPLKSWIMNNRIPNQSQLLLGLKGWQHHPVYDIVKTASIDFAMQSPIVCANEIIGSINFGRDSNEGRFNGDDLVVISILSHFLGLAITGSFANKSIIEYNNQFCQSIDNMRQNLIITDQNFDVNYANKAAQGTMMRHYGNQPNKQFSEQVRQLKESSQFSNKLVTERMELRTCPLPGSIDNQNLVFLDEIPHPIANEFIRNLLTSREIDVLFLVAKGLQNKEIAKRLFVSVNTVKRHLDNIFGKFNVSTRTKLIAKFYYMLYN